MDLEDTEEEEPELDPHTSLGSTLASLRRSTRHTLHTWTTYRQGRAVVSTDDDDDDDGGEGAAIGGGAASGMDVDWDDIQEDEE